MPSNGRNTPVLNVAVTSWDVLAAGAATSSVRFAGSVACPLPSALCLLRRPPHPAPAAQVVVTLSLRRHLGGYLCPCGGWSPFETEGRAAVPQVGERLGRYEVEKRCAVEKEDYDLAKEKKQQMELFRSRVYEQLQLHSLVDGELVGAPAPAAGGGPGARERGPCSPSWGLGGSWDLTQPGSQFCSPAAPLCAHATWCWPCHAPAGLMVQDRKSGTGKVSALPLAPESQFLACDNDVPRGELREVAPVVMAGGERASGACGLVTPHWAGGMLPRCRPAARVRAAGSVTERVDSGLTARVLSPAPPWALWPRSNSLATQCLSFPGLFARRVRMVRIA